MEKVISLKDTSKLQMHDLCGESTDSVEMVNGWISFPGKTWKSLDVIRLKQPYVCWKKVIKV